MSALASSSSSLTRKRKREFTYSIFLSFHGKDTRKGFTGHLYKALEQRGIKTFRDDPNLERGEVFATELLRAIGESWGSIIVISESYAFSSWCLDELFEIMKQRKDRRHRVYPIFYKVEPSNFRHLINKVKEAFDKHEKRHSEETMRGWRDALKEVADIHGWALEDQDESIFIEDVVRQVSKQIDAQEILDEQEVEMLKNSFRNGGLGKTTSLFQNTTVPLLLPHLSEGGYFDPITIRVIRVWETIIPTSDYHQSLDFLIVDCEGNAMQATMSSSIAKPFMDKLREGQMYTLNRFQVKPCKDSHNAIVNKYVILITRKTELEDLKDDFPEYPRHYFDFASFEQIKSRKDNPTFMTDVIGMLVAIGVRTSVTIGRTHKQPDKRDIFIKLKTGQELRVSVWRHLLEELDIDNLVQLKPRPIIIFAGTTVKTFADQLYIQTTSATKIHINLFEVPETADLMTRYYDEDTNVEILPTRSQKIMDNKLERKTVRQLMTSKPSIVKDKRFITTVKITGIDTSRGWYYNACDMCSMATRQQPSGFHCKTHGLRTPRLMMCLSVDLQDRTGEMEAVIFGTAAEKLTGVTVSGSTITGEKTCSQLPAVARNIINRTYDMAVGLMPQAVIERKLTYKIFKFKEITTDAASSAGSASPTEVVSLTESVPRILPNTQQKITLNEESQAVDDNSGTPISPGVQTANNA